jgi:hypothetical protein
VNAGKNAVNENIDISLNIFALLSIPEKEYG